MNRSPAQLINLVHTQRTSGTYKLALLRGLIELCLDRPHLFEARADGCHRAQMGALVDKWLSYYWPLAKSGVVQVQANSLYDDIGLFARAQEKCYGWQSYEVFRANFEAGRIKEAAEFHGICRRVAERIAKMPMHHFGFTKERGAYSIVRPVPSRRRHTGRLPLQGMDSLYLGHGEFELLPGYFDALRLAGHQLLGVNTILGEWFSMTRQLNEGRGLDDSMLFSLLNGVGGQELERPNLAALLGTQILKAAPKVCVWTQQAIAKPDWDHVLPWSVTRSNELWNLAPADPRLNRWEKRGEVPTPKALLKARAPLKTLWAGMLAQEPARFRFDCRFGLGLAEGAPEDRLLDGAFAALQARAQNYLDAGFPAWDGRP